MEPFRRRSPYGTRTFTASLLAIVALLFAAATAEGETIDGAATPAPASAPEAQAPTEEAQADPVSLAEEAQVDPASAAPVAEEPGETQEASSAPEPVAAAVEGGSAKSSSEPPASEPVHAALPSQPHMAKAVESVRHASSAVAVPIAAAADRLPGVSTGPARKLVDNAARQAHDAAGGPLLDLVSMAMGSLLSLNPLSPEVGSPYATLNPSIPPVQPGSFSPRGALGGPLPQGVAAPGGEGTVGAASQALKRSDEQRMTPLPAVGSYASSARAGADRGAGAAPSDVPLPTPGSPGAAAPDSGGPPFNPIAPLLALLALVTPAALRRLGRVPDFRPPTPFVCALERPG